MSEPKLSLISRKNIKEKEEEINELKEKIQKAVSLSCDVTFDFDYPNWAVFAEKAGYKDQPASTMLWFVDALASKLEQNFKEETAKAALQAQWTTGVVRFKTATNKKGENKYGSVDIDNGDLVYTIYQLSNVGNGVDELLDKLSDDASGLSVKAAQNLKQNEEQRTEMLQEIHDLVGLSADVTLDIDWPAFAKVIDKEGYKDQVGNCVGWFLDALKSNIKYKFKGSGEDKPEYELARNALQAVWTTGVIKMELGTNKKNENKYNVCSLRDGDLVVTVYQLSNAGSCGNELLSVLTDPALNLPLEASINIKNQEEKRDENLKEIQEAVGLTTDVTIDVDWSVLDPVITKSGYKNQAGNVIYDWILSNLKENIKRICKEELTKEALAEAWTTGVIRFEENKKINYHECDFKDGDLVISFKPENIATNTGNIGADIEKKL